MINRVINNLKCEEGITVIKKGVLPYLLSGFGLAWATQNENYSHYPICIFAPSMYIGYQSFMNKEHIIQYFSVYARELNASNTRELR